MAPTGPTARSLDLADERVYGVAFEGNLEGALVDVERWRSTVALDFGTVPGGYRWIFPKGDHLNVGVGGWQNAGPTLRAHLREFCEEQGFPYSKLRDLRGYRLPGRRPRAALAGRRALLVGDAAGLVEPLVGDGMYAAFLSSRLASEAAVNLLEGRVPDLEPYARSLVSELGPVFAFAWNAKAALDRFPRLAFRALVSPPGWRALENVVSGSTHDPERERGITGVAVRRFETLVRRAGWPGADYRTEAGDTRVGPTGIQERSEVRERPRMEGHLPG